jgi:hypothetical protein
MIRSVAAIMLAASLTSGVTGAVAPAYQNVAHSSAEAAAAKQYIGPFQSKSRCEDAWQDYFNRVTPCRYALKPPRWGFYAEKE